MHLCRGFVMRWMMDLGDCDGKQSCSLFGRVESSSRV